MVKPSQGSCELYYLGFRASNGHTLSRGDKEVVAESWVNWAVYDMEVVFDVYNKVVLIVTSVSDPSISSKVTLGTLENVELKHIGVSKPLLEAIRIRSSELNIFN